MSDMRLPVMVISNVQQQDFSGFSYCIVDVLKEIFEATAPVSRSYSSTNFVTSLTLASISRHWRMVALDTPRLWNHVQFSLRMPVINAADFWKAYSRRVRDVPANIYIRRDGSTDIDEINKRLIMCGLDRFKRISTIHIDVPPPTTFRSPRRAFYELHIQESFTTFKVSAYLALFKGFRKLRVDRNNILDVACIGIATYVTNLIIDTIEGLENYLVLESMSSLTDLRVSRARGLGGSINLPSLKRLSIRAGSIRLLYHLTCPSLLSLESYHAKENSILQFLLLHPTVIMLCICEGVNNAIWALGSPQLKYLRMHNLSASFYHVPSHNRAQAEFPILRTLELFHRGLTLLTFERLVRKRCLPRSHPESLLLSGTEPLHQLILHTSGRTFQEAYRIAAWTESKLLSSAILTHKWSTTFTTDTDWQITLAWPEIGPTV